MHRIETGQGYVVNFINRIEGDDKNVTVGLSLVSDETHPPASKSLRVDIDTAEQPPLGAIYLLVLEGPEEGDGTDD